MFIDETMNKYVLYKTICSKMAVLETRELQNKMKQSKVYLDNENMIFLNVGFIYLLSFMSGAITRLAF